MGESVDKVALMIKKRTRRDAMKVVDIVGDAEEIVDLTGNEVAAKALKTCIISEDHKLSSISLGPRISSSREEGGDGSPHTSLGSMMSTSREMVVPNLSANSTVVSASTRPLTAAPITTLPVFSPQAHPQNFFQFGQTGGALRPPSPADALMESASRNIMEGATSSANIMANMQQATMSEVMYKNGDMEAEKLQVVLLY